MTKTKRPTFTDFKERAMQDPAFREAYEELRPEYELLGKLIKARKKARCSQKELATRLKMQQPSIARLERGGYAKTTIAQLNKVAEALGYTMKVSFAPKKRSTIKSKAKTVKTKKA